MGAAGAQACAVHTVSVQCTRPRAIKIGAPGEQQRVLRLRRQMRRHTHTRCQVCQGAADRSLCMEWTPCMLEQCTRPTCLAPMHDTPCFIYSHRCARLVLAGAEKWQLVVIFRRSHQLQLIGRGSSARWPIGCSLFHAEAACESRERLVRCRPLSACTARTGRGRCLRRS